MAVTIIQQPGYIAVTSTNTDGSVISAHNRNVIEWSAVDPFEQGEIKITDLTNSRDYEFKRLVPNADTGNCKFDIQEVCKVAMQSSTSAKLSIRLTVVYADTTTEYTDIKLRVLRAVQQFGGRGTSMEEYDWFFGTTDTLCLALLPYKNLRADAQSIKIWSGYPLELWLINESEYSWNADGGGATTVTPTPEGIVTKHRLSTGDALTFTPTATNSGYIYFAINSSDPGNSGILLIKYKVIDTCGVYLRWVNPQGGYSYWLFGQWYQVPIKTKSLGMVQQTYDNIKDLLGDQGHIGQDVSKTIKVYDNNISKEDYEALVTLSRAKEVCLYAGEKLDNGYSDEATKWAPIRLVSFSANAEDTTRTLFKAAFEFELPKVFTQTL